MYVLDALERAHGEQFDQLLLTLLSAALLLCGGATLARALFLKQLEQKERDSVAPTARNKGAAVVRCGRWPPPVAGPAMWTSRWPATS